MRALFYSPQKFLFNGVLHAPIGDHLTFILRGFVIWSQIPNLIPTPFLTHAYQVYMNNAKAL